METRRKHIRNLLFDFGGTLDLPGAHWLDRFLRHYRDLGVTLTRDELDLAFTDATRRGYQAGERIYGFGLRQLVDELVSWQIDYLLLRMPGRVPESIRTRAPTLAQRFCLETAAGCEQSRAALAALAPHFKIGVVSNFYGNLETVLNETGLLPLIGAVADSARVGAFKPDPAIYRAALAMLGARPEETTMIGDSLGKDCAPARQLGLTTIWLTPATLRYTDCRAQEADLTAHTLQEVVEFCLGSI